MPFSLGLIGFPLGHSLSPQIHQAAIKALGLPGEGSKYRLYPVPPLPAGQADLARLAAAVRKGELDGLNVTIPHKTAILSLLDELTPDAEAIGAVNTLFRNGERLVGDNTDASGFLLDLERMLGFEPHQAGKQALVLGAGGAARAVVYALLHSGWRVFLAARHLEQAQAVANHLQRYGPLVVLPLEVEELHNLTSTQISLIVNATPVGMHPHPDSSPWPLEVSFPPGAAVYDLVYRPAETTLVRAARRSGIPAAGGLGMLVEQAALSFQRWTGTAPPRSALYAAAALEQKGESQ